MRLPDDTAYAMRLVFELLRYDKISEVEKNILFTGFSKISDLYCDTVELVGRQQAQIRFLESCMRSAQGDLNDKSFELQAVGEALSSAISLVESGVAPASSVDPADLDG